VQRGPEPRDAHDDPPPRPAEHDTDEQGRDKLGAAILAPAKNPDHPLRSARVLWVLLRATFDEWSEDNALRLGAALAYYTIFSLAPLLIIVIAIGGVFFGHEAAQGRLMDEISGMVGPQSAQAIAGMVEEASKPAKGLIASLVSIAAIVLGATGVFGELQSGLNKIWDVAPQATTWRSLLHHRLTSFGLVFGMGFLLLVSLVIGAIVSALDTWFAAHMPIFQVVLEIGHFVLSFTVVTLLFAMIFKMLPDVAITWGDVAVGATATALLFTVGQFLIGLYLGRSTVGSVYGAAGSLVVILLWVYYSSQILFFGAEFTQVYARRWGSHCRDAPR
jgi:membrane protein